MPQDYGDSWDQGQRCYFSFSLIGSSGLIQDGVNDEGEPIYIQQNNPFFQYDINRGGGSSNTKIFNAIELNTSITLTCTWQTHDEGKPGKPDIKANKIEVNQVIKVTGGSAKSSASFIGLVQSIMQPNKPVSKGVLVVKPIYILQNVFDKTSPIENWSVICNENKTSNYEINEKYACVEAFGLTGGTSPIGYAEVNINYDMTAYDAEYNDSPIDYYNTLNISGGEGPDVSSSTSQHYETQNVSVYTFKTFGIFNMYYYGDINYFPWKDISVNSSVQIRTNTLNFTNEGYSREYIDPDNQYGYLTSTENGFITTSKQENTYSNFNFSYTFKKSDFENYKKYQTDEESENLNKFSSSLTLKNYYKNTQLTSTATYSLRNEGYSYQSFSSVTTSYPTQHNTEIIEYITSIKITPSGFLK